MDKTLKFNDPNLKVFFGSDIHYGHNKSFIFSSRGFSTIQEHDEWIISDINSLITPRDIFIFLGDVLPVARKPEQIGEFWSKIHCKNIYSIFGNHNVAEYLYYKTEVQKVFGKDFKYEIYPFKIGNLTFLGNYAEIEVLGDRVIASHYAFSIWNKSHYGSFCLSGHSHGTNPETLPDSKKGMLLDCGVDVAKNYWNHSIFSWEIIKEIMANKEIDAIDHHNIRTLE